MRRIASLGLLLAMTGCSQYVGSPFDGFGGFAADTHTIYRNPNRPAGDTENMRRVFGEAAQEEPLLPEPGNVWPGPLPPQMTLQDLQRENPDATLKSGEEMYLGRPLGSSTPPGTGQVRPATPAPMQMPQAQPAPRDPTVMTPSGPAMLQNNGGVQTYTDPRGGTGIVVPNGNGTSTLIAPDGSVQTVPSPR